MKATVTSISSTIAARVTTEDLKVFTVLKFFKASRAASTCFLKDDSEGIIDMLAVLTEGAIKEGWTTTYFYMKKLFNTTTKCLKSRNKVSKKPNIEKKEKMGVMLAKSKGNELSVTHL